MIKRQGHGARETFTVRKQSFGWSSSARSRSTRRRYRRIQLAARGRRPRRAKLYYLRDRVGKRARVRERRYAGPEEAIEPGLLHEPTGATDADGMTAEESVNEVVEVEQGAAAEAAEGAEATAGETAGETEAPAGEAPSAEAEAPAHEETAEAEPQPEPEAEEASQASGEAGDTYPDAGDGEADATAPAAGDQPA